MHRFHTVPGLQPLAATAQEAHVQSTRVLAFKNATNGVPAEFAQEFTFPINNSPTLASITVDYQRAPRHGAPCHLWVNGTPENEADFHAFMKTAIEATNQTNDRIPFLVNEGSVEWGSLTVGNQTFITTYPNHTDQHNYTSGKGDEPNAGIDTISPDTVLNVVRKFLVHAVQQDQIDAAQANRILSTLDHQICVNDPALDGSPAP